MKYFGLHWIDAAGLPLQVRIEIRTQKVWARYCDSAGIWSPWRRLDVDRNSNGTLKETVENATNAKSSDTAKRLAKKVAITLSGDVRGSASFDGANPVTISTSLQSSALEGLENELAQIMARLQALEAGSGNGGDNAALGDILQRLSALENNAHDITALNNTVQQMLTRQDKIIQEIKVLREFSNLSTDSAWEDRLQLGAPWTG